MIKLTILSPERKIADHIEVESVTLPGSEGEIQILPQHVDMIGTIETGMFSYKMVSGKEFSGVFSSGFFEVVDHKEVIVTTETCEFSADIDVSRAKTAQKKAETALSNPELEQAHFRKYQLKLQRALIRQQVAGSLLH